MAAEVEIVINAQDNASGVLGNFGSIITGIESAINLVSQAFDFAAGVITPFIDSASESEQAVARLDGVLRATGGAAGLTSGQLQSMADALQNTTRFSDETILAGEALLLTFRNITGETFERTVPAMLDMAEIFGSVDSAAMQLGKALNDPLTGMGALSRAGITFSEEQKKMIKSFVEMGDVASAQNIILSEVEAQVSGLAETMGDTFTGKAEIFKNKIDTIKETLGAPFLDILGNVIDRFTAIVEMPEVLDFFNSLNEAIGEIPAEGLVSLVGILDELGTALEAIGLTGAENFFINLKEAFESGDFTPLIESIGNALEDALIEGIQSVDWNAIGLQFNQSMQQEFDFTADGGALSQAIGDAFTALVAGAFGYMDWDSLAIDFREGVLYVLHYGFDDLGRDLGLFDTLKSIFSFGFDDIISLIKTKLGISSPSSVFSNIARDMVAGLITGWSSSIGNFIGLIEDSIAGIIDLFPNWLQDAIGLGGASAAGLGSAGGGTTGGTVGGGTGTQGGAFGGAQTVTINNYGPVYYMGAGEPGAYYDCPSPNPLVAASANQLVTSGF